MTVMSSRIANRYAIVVVVLAGLLAAFLPAAAANAATTYSISGKVTLAAGAPSGWLKGVDVYAESTTGVYGYASVDPATGNYSVTGLVPGSYTLSFDSYEYWDSATSTTVEPNLVDEYYNNSLTPTGATKVTITSANVTGINASLAIGREISGKITLPAGTSTSAYEALSVYADSATSFGSGDVSATGNYVIRGLPAGSYVVNFVVGGVYDYDTGERWYPNLVDEYYNNSATYAGATAVNVSSGSVANINATLATGRSISGKVTLPAGAPAGWLDGVSVYAGNINLGHNADVDPATGNYTVTGLGAGSYTVAFWVNTYYDETAGTSVVPNLKDQYYNAKASSSTANKVTVGSSNVTGINATLAYKTVATFTTVPTPTVSGTATQGNKLTAGVGTWSPKPDSYGYQWYRDGVAISGSIFSQYRIAVADAGHKVTVKVTGIKTGYTSASKVSAQVSVPLLSYTTVPTPAVSGTATVGNKVTAYVGTWAPKPDSYAYQWYRDGVAIPGATFSQYKITVADAGHQVSVVVTAIKVGYTKTGKGSARVSVPLLTYTTVPTPTISGTATSGNKMTANVGTWSPTPDSYGYQWYRDGVAISGATLSQYMLTASDTGHQVSVVVTGKKTGYTRTSKGSARTTIS